MASPKSNLYTCLWLMYFMTSCNSAEPHCSKFPYEEALLEKLVRLEFKVEQMDSGIRAVQDNVLEELNKLKKDRENSIAFRKQLEEEIRVHSSKTVEQMDSGIRAVQDKVLEELNKLKKEREDNVVFRKQMEEEMKENSNKTQAQVLKQAESVIDEIQGNIFTFHKAFNDMAIAQNHSLDKLQDFAEASNILFRARDVSNLTPSARDTMIYTNVMTNQGSGYNSADGIFTAPVPGLYLFSAQFCSLHSKYFYFAFYVDRTKEQATMIGSSEFDCITSVMSIELRKSSEVSIKCTSRGSTLFTDPYRWNIFSGVLIRPINYD